MLGQKWNSDGLHVVLNVFHGLQHADSPPGGKDHKHSKQLGQLGLWNDLPEDIRMCDSLRVFKKKLKTLSF